MVNSNFGEVKFRKAWKIYFIFPDQATNKPAAMAPKNSKASKKSSDNEQDPGYQAKRARNNEVSKSCKQKMEILIFPSYLVGCQEISRQGEEESGRNNETRSKAEGG